MKLTICFMMMITLLSCSNAKKVTANAEQPAAATEEPNVLINDIWVAETIMGLRYEPNARNTPQMEFQIGENRVAGNDGCNTFSGSTITLDNKNLVFGPMMSTKMACENMNTPKLFQDAMRSTVAYKIEKLRLYLYNEDGVEVMILKKVD
jgi:heat shock protein HslJ